MKRSIVILMIALFSSILFSGTTGKIKGIVTDENGEPLEGANIMVVGKTWGAETDEDGYYYIIGVRAGTYQVKCQYIGYSPKTVANLKVRVGLTSSQNYKLVSEAIEIGEMEITVYQDEKVEMDVTTSVRSVNMGTMGTQAVTEVSDVLNNEAGIKKDADGGLHFRGGRSGEVSYVIDGISVGDPTGAKDAPVSINFANVESFNIQKGVPDAEYGDALSGSVNIVMKIGDQDKTSGHVKYTTDSFLGDSKLDYTRGEFSISGPIPIPGMSEKPTYYIATDLTTQNGFSQSYRDLGDRDGDYYEFGDFDITNLGFDVAQKRENNFNIIFKTAYQITPKMSVSTSYTASRSHDYDFSWLYRYTPQTANEVITDVAVFNVSFKHTINQQSYYDLIFSYYNRKLESLPGGNLPTDFVFEDETDQFSLYGDMLSNNIRDGGDAEGYFDLNLNGYFDREYFIDANGNSNYDMGEDFVDADNNGLYDGDGLFDSGGSSANNEWDYWEAGQSFSGFVGGDFTTVGGVSVTVPGTMTSNIYNNSFDIVEGYIDQNLSGHYEKDIYDEGLQGSYEHYVDGDHFFDTGEPYIDQKRLMLTTSGIKAISNKIWNEATTETFALKTFKADDDSLVNDNLAGGLDSWFWSALAEHESNNYYNASYSTRNSGTYEIEIELDVSDPITGVPYYYTIMVYDQMIDIDYSKESFLDLRSSLGSSAQPNPRLNLVYDKQWNGVFDEFEAYSKFRPNGSSTDESNLGWTTGHSYADNPSDYVEYVGSYVIYKAPTSVLVDGNLINMYDETPNVATIPLDSYSTWINNNGDVNSTYNVANNMHDDGESFEDYNSNGVWNLNPGFLLPDEYYDGTRYQLFDNTVYKLKGNYTNQLNKFHMIKTGFELALNELDYYSNTNPYYAYDTANQEVIEGDPFPENGETKTYYQYKPIEFSMYVQDKMEFEDLVVNAGIRLDMRSLDQDAIDYYESKYNSEGSDQFGYEEELEPTIYAISPRFGISHSISESSKLFFSYGHLYMKPSYTAVFAPNATTDTNPLFGNMNLGYERNVQYELGVVNELGLYLVDITGYFKDIYDMINTKTYDYGSHLASVYYNSDYGKSRGVEIAVDRSLQNHYLWGVNYVLAYAYGKSSDAESNFDTDITDDDETELIIKEYPLIWDERHQISSYFTLMFGKGETLFDIPYTDNWSIGMNTSFGSGTPFTPSAEFYDGDVASEDIQINSERMPWTSSTDLKISKTFAFTGENNVSYGNLKFDFNIYNLFNKINVLEVYEDTGSWSERSDLFYTANSTQSNFSDFYTDLSNIAERRHYRFGVSYAW
ncbi:MAG: TonB-dependent receptor [Candidatus Delongbacteria bacterium]|nr:TonB-dependent receptor [Candidatus Delongbacteria bacterium]